MNTLTIEQAIEKAPSIGGTEKSPNTSDRYQFVSTRSVLEKVMTQGWNIVEAKSQGRSLYAQHKVTLVHNRDLSLFQQGVQKEGLLRVDLFNSHNRSRRFMMAMGYFRQACSNGLLVATGPAETIRTRHLFSDDRLESIMERIDTLSDRFPKVLETIEAFKSREMSEEEQIQFAQFGLRSRYLYRKELPKKVSGDSVVTRLLEARRPEDEGSSAWVVLNRIQESLIRGVDGLMKGTQAFGDNIRTNQFLWRGAEMALQYSNSDLNNRWNKLLVKDRQRDVQQTA
jgi:hypothetical protein